MRVVVQQVLVEAYNANLADLEARGAALRAAADALLAAPDEMLTGGWGGSHPALVLAPPGLRPALRLPCRGLPC